ncbi:MAG: hypothetical protein ACFFB5_13240 [Promethearchaeota archaeon]
MAVDYGMSLIDELKEILARRRNVLEIFGTYKVMYDELLQDLVNTYNTDVDTAVSAFYLANYVMDTLKRDKEARDRGEEDERVHVVLKNLIIARKHLTLDFESLVHIYSLLYDWAVKIEKDLVTHARLLVNQKVITTNLVDIYAVPLFSFLKQAIPNLDLRWAMAELAGALNKGFASEFYSDITKKFAITKMDPQFYFDAGFFVIQPFVEDYFAKKFEDGVKELESFGDIGRRSNEFACSIFYDIDSKELFSPISYDEKIVQNEVLEQELNNSIHMIQTLSGTSNPQQLLFAKFHVQIRVPGQRPEERFFYIHNFEENSPNNGFSNSLGNWNYLLLSEQNVNLQSIISYSKQRCIDIRGISSRLKDQIDTKTEHMDMLLSAWMEMYIHNLQEEYNFLEIKDELREQGLIPIGFLKQDINQANIVEMIIDTPKEISSKRMDTLGIKSFMVTRDQTKQLLDHIKLITDHCLNVLRLILLQTNQDFEISFYPVEFLYKHQKHEGRNISVFFSTDETRIVGLICQNEASLEFQVKSLKQRQVFSKINQLLTELRVKTMIDARATKLEQFILHGAEDFNELGSLRLSGKVEESFGVTLTDESVTDRIDLAIKKEQARIEAMRIAEKEHQEELEKERQTRLNAQRILYFNEILKDFFEEFHLEIQDTMLNLLKERFPDVYRLEQEQRGVKLRLKDFREKQKENNVILVHMREILRDLLPQLLNKFKINISECLSELEKIWELVSKMSEDDLSKV